MGHQQVIDSMQMWTNPTLSAVTVWSNHGPPGGYRQHPIRVDISQLHAISITYLLREIGQLESIGRTDCQLRGSHGPLAVHRQYADVGQPHAIAGNGLE